MDEVEQPDEHPFTLMSALRQRGIEFRYQLPNDGGEIRCAADGTVSVSPAPAVAVEGNQPT